MTRNSLPLRASVRSLGLLAAAALGLSIVSCFEDTPVEPDGATPRTSGAFVSAGSNVTDLGTLGGEFSQAQGINSTGEIVGESDISGPVGVTTSHGFIWRNGTMTDLLGADVPYSSAVDISDAGHVVGEMAESDGSSKQFLWRSGTRIDLPPLPGDDQSTATAVNASGQAVGTSWVAVYNQPRAVLWQSGVPRYLGSLGGGTSVGIDINGRGQVVGWSQPTSQGDWYWNAHAFLWQSGSMRDLGTLGGQYSQALSINNLGQVVGDADLANGDNRAFLWEAGHMTDLGTLGGSTSSVGAINDSGQVVGTSTTSDRSGGEHGFVWRAGVMTDLGTGGGTYPADINNAGQIVGQLIHDNQHAVRWTIPTSNFWSVLPRPFGRSGVAVAAASGLLYVIGGNDRAGAALSAVQAYNPGTNSWAPKAGLPAARQGGNGAATIGGMIYVAGGKNAAGTLTRTLYAYNPGANSWTTRAPMPLAGGCGGSAAIAGRLYVFSGCTPSSAGGQVPARVLHRYDPGTNTWSTLTSAPAVHFQPAVSAIGGKLYVAGGNTGSGIASRRLDVFDPATNTWTTRAAMPTARVAAAAAVTQGRLYVIGGRNGTTYLDAVEAYDPLTNSWSAPTMMINPRAGLGAAGIGQLIYTVGGRNSNRVLSITERYTPGN